MTVPQSLILDSWFSKTSRIEAQVEFQDVWGCLRIYWVKFWDFPDKQRTFCAIKFWHVWILRKAYFSSFLPVDSFWFQVHNFVPNLLIIKLGIPIDRVPCNEHIICGVIRGLLIQHDRFLVLFCCKHYQEKFIMLLLASNMTPLGGKVALIRSSHNLVGYSVSFPEYQNYQEFCNVLLGRTFSLIWWAKSKWKWTFSLI